jgi:hypothetical protein
MTGDVGVLGAGRVDAIERVVMRCLALGVQRLMFGAQRLVLSAWYLALDSQ